MDKDYFVMLTHPAGQPEMMSGEDMEPVWYATEEEAVKAAKTSWLGSEIGFEVFQLGCGEKAG